MRGADPHGRASILSPKWLGRDLLASVVVFFVALPLCMGIAIASGAPPVAGLVTGIVGGLLVGTIGGAPLQVSGPAAGLAVIVWDLVQRYGIAALGPIVVLAGLFQIAAGAARLGRWFQAVPPSVIFGMLAGIGVLIFASQFHVMVDDTPKKSGIANIVSIPGAIWKGLVPSADHPHDDAAIIGVVTLASIVLWSGVVARKWARAKVVPAPLVGIVIAAIVANVARAPIAYVTLPDQFFGALHLPNGAALGELLAPDVVLAALGLALVASAETLLCAGATDRMHAGPRTNYDREMMAQGLGNAVAGLVGGLPMTGVIVRSSANVDAGAKTRRSAILHGVWLVVAVALVPFVLRRVPVSGLAALLVYTGTKLIGQDVKSVLRRGGKSEVAILFATIAGIVATDLLKGVLFGLALAILKVAWTFTRLDVHVEHAIEEKTTSLTLVGSATFLRLPRLTSALASIPPAHRVEVQLERLERLDHAAFDALETWAKQHRARGGSVVMDGQELEIRVRRNLSPAVQPG